MGYQRRSTDLRGEGVRTGFAMITVESHRTPRRQSQVRPFQRVEDSRTDLAEFLLASTSNLRTPVCSRLRSMSPDQGGQASEAWRQHAYRTSEPTVGRRNHGFRYRPARIDRTAYTGILVVVDRLTKMAIYLPCRKDVDSPELARMFFEEVICKHGVPSNIVTDRGSQFTRLYNTF
jgi:hypothetical protein